VLRPSDRPICVLQGSMPEVFQISKGA